ncbi:MAG: hypothetical protein IT455_10410 [Planctomycetes bacterium]|nr:hypothetical protein [Planctomycetota bacterium]
MRTQAALRSLALAATFAAFAAAQDWSDDQLVAATAGFQTDTLPARLAQAGKLLAERKPAFSAMVARIHGDHREYQLKIEHLLGELADPRWQVRETAERTLIEIGGRAMVAIQQKKEHFEVLEQQWRCARILDALVAKGNDQEERERKLLHGLVTTALYLDPEPRLLRALRSAVGHTDAGITDGAIRALGKLGGDEEADAVAGMLTHKNGMHRLVAVAALARMQSPKALAYCKALLGGTPRTGRLEGVTLDATARLSIVRTLHQRREDAGAQALLAELKSSPDALVAAAAKATLPPAQTPAKARFTLPDKDQRLVVDGTIGGFLADAQLVVGAFPELPVAELSFTDCDTIDFPDHAAAPTTTARVFLNQGSLIAGEVLAIDPETVRVRSPLFGDLVLPRAKVQGIAYAPTLDRLIGASSDHERVRLKSTEFVDGELVNASATQVVVNTSAGQRSVPIAEVDGLLFKRPPVAEPDPTTYTRLDLVTGERLIGFLADTTGDHFAVVVPDLGATALPLTQVMHVELGVGGGAMWGFTLIADYSDNRVVEVDEQGRVVFAMEDVFGAWDAECLDNGNLLITEFSVSRVREVDRKGNDVWAFEDLKNPYDADRLPNGNTLIADTFGSRVLEVDKAGQIVWSFTKDIRPFDVDRLANGNTLVCDVIKDRVIEIAPNGDIVWEVKGMPNAHDADRLPNGNTLITLRNKGQVVEVDRDGKIVWQLDGLSSPSDADRLPNGNTLVAENLHAREFDRRGNEVWKKEMTWSVEANRY